MIDSLFSHIFTVSLSSFSESSLYLISQSLSLSLSLVRRSEVLPRPFLLCRFEEHHSLPPLAASRRSRRRSELLSSSSSGPKNSWRQQKTPTNIADLLEKWLFELEQIGEGTYGLFFLLLPIYYRKRFGEISH